MSKFLITVSILFTLQTFAADLKLADGQSATIKANTEVRVTCGAEPIPAVGLSCPEANSILYSVVASCIQNLGPTSKCAKNQWESHKSVYPKCGGQNECLEACQKNAGGDACVDICQ